METNKTRVNFICGHSDINNNNICASVVNESHKFCYHHLDGNKSNMSVKRANENYIGNGIIDYVDGVWKIIRFLCYKKDCRTTQCKGSNFCIKHHEMRKRSLNDSSSESDEEVIIISDSEERNVPIKKVAVSKRTNTHTECESNKFALPLQTTTTQSFQKPFRFVPFPSQQNTKEYQELINLVKEQNASITKLTNIVNEQSYRIEFIEMKIEKEFPNLRSSVAIINERMIDLQTTTEKRFDEVDDYQFDQSRQIRDIASRYY